MIDLAFYSYTYVKMYLLVIHLKMTIKHKKYVYPWPIISSTIAVYLMSLYSAKEWKVAAMCTQLFCQSQTTSCKAKLLHITLGSTVCFLPIYTFIQSSISTQYGNTGCGVFKRGVQNKKDFCIRINIFKGNYGILSIGLMASCQK